MSQSYAIQILWGYWSFYAVEPSHHTDYCMDGQATTENGCIVNIEMIQFDGCFGPCWERYIPLPEPNWHWHVPRANKRLGGIRFMVEGNEDTLIHFSTRTIEFRFSIGEIFKKKVIRHHVGPREQGIPIVVLLDGYDPNLDTSEDIAEMNNRTGRWHRLLHAGDFKGSHRRWFRTDWVWVSPGRPMEVEIDKPEWHQVSKGGERVLRAVFRCISAVPENSPASDKEFVKEFRNWRMFPGEVSNQDGNKMIELGQPVTLPYKVYLNGKMLAEGNQHFSKARNYPLVEEICVDLPESVFLSGRNLLRLETSSKNGYILVCRLFLEEIHQYDFEIVSSPRWVLIDEPFYIKLRCRKHVKSVKVNLPAGIICLDEFPRHLDIGEHRVKFQALEPLANAEIVFTTEGFNRNVNIEQVVTVKTEPFPMRVGMEDFLISPHSPGLHESMIIELKDTQLGDFFIFRPDLRPEDYLDGKADGKLAAWSRLCYENGVYHVIWDTYGGPNVSFMQREGREYFCAMGLNEWDGDIWGYRRTWQLDWKVKIPPDERTMKTAQANHIEYMGHGISVYRGNHKDVPFWFNVSSIGHDFAYRAGADIVVSQFNKSHNVLLLADLRGASRTHGKSIWGCYIAEGAHLQPETNANLRMWWLALHISYICGASYVNDEECLYRNYHERLYAHGDRFPRMRREILRQFNRFVKSHPHRRIPKVKQALLIGQHACDIGDWLDDSDPPPRVWGTYGAKRPEWAHATPEYGLRYLDVFFPGVWLQSLVQSPMRNRRFYSGTPYGELELIPIEAGEEILKQFKLLLLLGWNTMDEQIYDKLKGYVAGGGTLFLSLPHFTTNESRKFLAYMEPLNLLKGVDFTDFLGLKVKGRGQEIVYRFVRTKDGAGLGLRNSYEITNSQVPFHPMVTFAECEISDAEVLAVDSATGTPLLVKRRLGKGEVYVLLTYDYPGNSNLSGFMTDLIHTLAKRIDSPVNLNDPSGDIYYTVREENDTGLVRIHLLNTDWTEQGNERNCILRLGEKEIPLVVKEGRLSEVVWFGDLAILAEDYRTYIESISKTDNGYSVKIHGYSNSELLVCHLIEKPFANLEFEGKPLKINECKGWMRIAFDFGYRSIGMLRVL